MAGLPLPRLESPTAQEDELEWYFKDSRAEQGGLRSNQGAIERALEMGLREKTPVDSTPRTSQFRAIRRARRIERRLMMVEDTPLTVLCLAHKPEQRLRHLGARGVLYVHLPIAHVVYEAAGKPLTLFDWLVLLSDRLGRGVASKADKRLCRQLRNQAEKAYAYAVSQYGATR